jgi:hypothetical protein
MPGKPAGILLEFTAGRRRIIALLALKSHYAAHNFHAPTEIE